MEKKGFRKETTLIKRLKQIWKGSSQGILTDTRHSSCLFMKVSKRRFDKFERNGKLSLVYKGNSHSHSWTDQPKDFKKKCNYLGTLTYLIFDDYKNTFVY